MVESPANNTTEKPVSTIAIKFAKKYYFQGEQVSGEVFLDVPASLSGVAKLELKAWAIENFTWLARHNGKKTTYRGSKQIYSACTAIKEFSNGTLENGCYLVPFTFYLPFKIGASTSFKGRQFGMFLSHFVEVQLVPQLPTILLEATDKGTPYIAQQTQELMVLEKPGFQATLKPYAWQCAYTIPHMLLGTGDLTITIRKGMDPFIPGEEIPLCIDFQNQSKTTVTDVFVTLLHKIAGVSPGGIYKEITYPHTKWRKPCIIRGGTKSSQPVSCPVKLPQSMASTSHGAVITSDWEIRVSCRYKGNYTVTHHITNDDLVIPLTIWNPDPVLKNGEELKKMLTSLAVAPTEPDDSAGKTEVNQESIETTVVASNTQVTEWPPISIELSAEGGKPGVNTIVRLVKELKKETPEAQPKPEDVYKVSTRLDLGTTMSSALAKILFPPDQSVRKAKKQQQHREMVHAGRVKVAPLQK